MSPKGGKNHAIPNKEKGTHIGNVKFSDIPKSAASLASINGKAAAQLEAVA